MATRLRVHSPAVLYFDAVRRAGSIREAARRLHVASSAVNRQILKLEDEIGAPLFERLPGGLKLTAAGEVFARHAIVVLQDAERARSELDALKGLRTGHVEVATVEGVTTDLLPVVIGRLREDFPNITIGIATLGSQAIPGTVTNGTADLGLAFALPRTAELRQLTLARFRLGAVMPPDHPLAGREEVSVATCMAYPLVLAKQDLSVHHLMRPAMERAGATARGVVRSGSVELSKELARRGIGIAFQTRIGLETDLNRGSLVHLPLNDAGPVYSDLGIYARAGRALPVAVDAFARLLGEEMARREAAEAALLPAPT
ncbi:LysR family transcriptional regulator [Alloalcanivorax marinus]|uniref:LysR family transcriptional regulator n=1 Tax=Alloalcanivorax marinus TaxID=1177169 RepID=UPI00193452A6|nr:LysR family transcriptional regulator [Alloalcanivorax marinus]MBL7252424.1 LysR family transcriptional regulator [Alloalcanivorax marinus]